MAEMWGHAEGGPTGERAGSALMPSDPFATVSPRGSKGITGAVTSMRSVVLSNAGARNSQTATLPHPQASVAAPEGASGPLELRDSGAGSGGGGGGGSADGTSLRMARAAAAKLESCVQQRPSFSGGALSPSVR